jgi:hypothetical protein
MIGGATPARLSGGTMRIRRLVTAGACLAVAAGWIAAALAQNALAGLGVQETGAKRDIIHALVNGNVNVYPARQAFKAAAPAARAALVKGAIDWARAYTESPAFKAQYDQERGRSAPAPPKPKNVDEELARQKAERHKSIDEAKKNLEKMPANIRPQLESTIRQMEADNAKRDADPQFASMMRQSMEIQIAAEQKQHQESLARYNQRYPADPRVLVAARLRQFLDVSKDVDFGAALAPAGDRQRFANAAYESKPSEWKLCYRAGKEATMAGREAAQAWLAALGAR